jgi:hypothetical protein
MHEADTIAAGSIADVRNHLSPPLFLRVSPVLSCRPAQDIHRPTFCPNFVPSRFVKTDMNTAGDQLPAKAQLWQEYRQAFQQFARTADFVESLKQCANPSQAAIEVALLEREKAFARYERCRDALAAALLLDSSRRSVDPSVFTMPHEHPERVKEIAESLWELENKPEGKADDEWFRAESILRRAMEGQVIPVGASAGEC